MAKGLKTFGVISALLSFVLCLAAGLWILWNVGFKTGEDAVWTGLGLYFVGKSVFVGPLLILTAARYGERG